MTSPTSASTAHSSSTFRQAPTPLKSIPLTPTTHITICPFTTAPSTVLDTLSDPTHPTNANWPTFTEKGPSETTNINYGNLTSKPCFRPWQLVAIFHNHAGGADQGIASSEQSATAGDGTSKIVADALSIPFYWPTHHDSLSLSDEGWEFVLAAGNMPGSPPPNALSGIAVSVDPEFRAVNLVGRDGSRVDLATELLKCLKQLAKEAGFVAMVVPVRPTRKALGENVWIDMETYVRVRRGEVPGEVYKRTLATKLASPQQREGMVEEKKEMGNDEEEVYDPWIRKHMQMGAHIVKVCPRSAVVERSVKEWQEWTKVDFSKPCMNPFLETGAIGGGGEEAEGSYEVVIPGGLVPVRVYPKRKIVTEEGTEEVGVGMYVEPNVWVRHF
ncbi:hypothetical protein BDZ91DRAFT_315645 [Kalaharituber pfeilii]|nr:hypothetical protein BDZ91DRAFT_315645 [Kalaharituber pfeilii]